MRQAPSSETTEPLETIKSQLWASIQEAAKWKDEAAQLAEEIEAAQADAEKWKEEHAQILQEIDAYREAGIQHLVAEPRQRDLDSWLRCGEGFSKIFERAGS